jgi:hypothetical protein
MKKTLIAMLAALSVCAFGVAQAEEATAPAETAVKAPAPVKHKKVVKHKKAKAAVAKKAEAAPAQ